MVPVRLIRAQNDFHKSHPDQRLCQATIRTMDELASLLGPSEVCYISQDDKARVAIGITAANVQAPMLMHMQYRVKLPDHDWVVAAGHKLIPSVYAGIAVDRNGLGMPGAVGYSGPTYVAIRSGKHCSSTALSHCMDYERLLNLPEFNSITKSSDERVKPIVMFSVDGGPDENPRYNKVIEVAIHHFVSHDLDAIFIFTNAPGRSAHNRAERRMAPLSRPLSGLILPHNYYGNHLDAAGKTIDMDLEKQNFEKAGTTLAEVWSEVVFDEYPCVAEYVDPNYYEFSQDRLNVKDQYWFSEHVRTSQYFTQIVQFQSQLLDRICQKCSLYFASKVMLKSHMIVHKKKTQSASAVVEKEFIVTRTRPVRIAAMRQREIMAIIVSDDNNGFPQSTETSEGHPMEVSHGLLGHP
ncbi:uncharacterized protein LOC123475557 [Daphnia magna]|uniref:uncharacterized protein LOC123475557 n=1 Tax=Daphnia magna TaxID=35525 RepID=UPI001E1BD768|nr:uncharacterized protein LOC123475557 [Daphnia magna]